jgi:exodeoxyribonuclease VII large subunit
MWVTMSFEAHGFASMTRLPDFGEIPSTPNPPWDNAIRLRDLLDAVRQTLRTAFKKEVWVFAEAQDIKRAEQGHVYLTLVDANEGQVSTRAILWASQGGQRLANREQERGEALGRGEKIIALCSPEYHTSYGFRLIVTDIQFADTLGPAERRLRDALKKLAREGIITKNQELPVPFVALRVALITPRLAEGSLDFQQILLQERKRAPTLVRVYHAVFQSEAAAQDIPTAITGPPSQDPI